VYPVLESQKVIHSRFLRVIQVTDSEGFEGSAICAGAMLIFSVSFQFLRMMPKHSGKLLNTVCMYWIRGWTLSLWASQGV